MPSMADIVGATFRPSWHETRIAMARSLAKRSLCTRDQVGAIIVDKQFKIIGEGYNGPARYTEHEDKPCTEWCPRASSERKIVAWSNAHFPGELEINQGEGTFHLWDGYPYERMLIPDVDEFMKNHGGEPVYEEKKADYSDCPSLHAEANALMASDRSLRAQGMIYITSHPCLACAKLIANSGLTGVFVGHDGKHEYRRDDAVYKYLKDLGISVWEVLV